MPMCEATGPGECLNPFHQSRPTALPVAPPTFRPWFITGQSEDGSSVDIGQEGRGLRVCIGVPVRAAGVVIEEHNAEIRRMVGLLEATVRHLENCDFPDDDGRSLLAEIREVLGGKD